MLFTPQAIHIIDPINPIVRRPQPRLLQPDRSQADKWSDEEFAELMRQRTPKPAPATPAPIDKRWHIGAPPHPGTYDTRMPGNTGSYPRNWNGSTWSYRLDGPHADKRHDGTAKTRDMQWRQP